MLVEGDMQHSKTEFPQARTGREMITGLRNPDSRDSTDQGFHLAFPDLEVGSKLRWSELHPRGIVV